MEWLQDRLLRLAARYYCQDMDVDASKLQIEKWDSESCRVRATDLKLTNEHGSLSVAECTVERITRRINRDQRHCLNSGALEIHRRRDGERLARAGRQPGSGHPRGRAGGAKLRVRNAAVTTNTTDSTINWDVAVASFHTHYVARPAVSPQHYNAKCDWREALRRYYKKVSEGRGGCGRWRRRSYHRRAVLCTSEEAAPHLKKVGEGAARSRALDVWYEYWVSTGLSGASAASLRNCIDRADI